MRIALLTSLCLGLIATGQNGAQDAKIPPELLVIRQMTLHELGLIHSQKTEAELNLRASYMGTLIKARARLAAGDNPDILRNVSREIDRFSREKHWDVDEKRNPIPAPLKPAFDHCKAQMAQLELGVSAKRAPIIQTALQKLEPLKTMLTKGGRIDEAVAIKSFVDGLHSLTPKVGESPIPTPPGAAELGTTNKAQIANTLAETVWQLEWVGGDKPNSNEQLSFCYGRHVKTLSPGRNDPEVLPYTIHDDLSIRITERSPRTLRFDPSFTYAYMYNDRGELIRRCRLGKRIEPPTSLRDDILIYYNFDDVTGTESDRSGNGHNALATRTSTVHYGRRNNAVLFNGRSSQLELQTELDPDNYNTFSIATWIYVEPGAPNSAVIHWPGETKNAGVRISCSKDTLYVNLGHENGYTQLKTPWPAGAWHHLAISHNGYRVICLYIDGKLQQTRPANPLANTAPKLRLGTSPNEARREYFLGMMDEFFVFKRSLSPAEVNTLIGWAAPAAE